MRCSVCGRNTQSHTVANWGLFKKEGHKLVLTAGPITGVSRCSAVRIFQSHLLAGIGELRKIKSARIN